MPDKYANLASIRIIPTLNTLSWEELATHTSVFEKKAFLVNRLEYFLSNGLVIELVAASDSVAFGISTSNTFSTASLRESTVADFNKIDIDIIAGGAATVMVDQPFVKDLSTLPGGGLLLPARPIYLWMVTTGMAGAGQIDVRLYFTIVDLKADEYWELVESTRLIA